MNKNDQTINEIIRLMRSDESTDAPADAVRWSKNIFRARIVAPEKSVFKKITAILQMNLAPNQAAFGERSASGGQARQMLFQADANTLDIRLTKTKNGYHLRGQILGEDFADATIVIGAINGRLNELGEFNLEEIPNGKYQMLIRKDEKEIVVEDFELK